MIDSRFIFIALLFNLWGSLGYSWATIQGKTKPNRISWLLWGIIPLIAFAASEAKGAGLAGLMTLMVGVGPLLIFISSFINPSAYWKISKLDIACGLLSVMAIIWWLHTSNADYAIAISILADLIAGIPTIRKSWSDPASENPIVFRNAVISAIITLLTIKIYTFASVAFPIYILILGIAMFSVITFKLGIQRRTETVSGI